MDKDGHDQQQHKSPPSPALPLYAYVNPYSGYMHTISTAPAAAASASGSSRFLKPAHVVPVPSAPSALPPWRRQQGSAAVPPLQVLPVPAAPLQARPAAPAPPKMPAGAGAPAPSPQEDRWPPSLCAYVDCNFGACPDDAAKSLVHQALKRKILDVISQCPPSLSKYDALSRFDWGSEPLLPVPGLEKEKRKERFALAVLAGAEEELDEEEPSSSASVVVGKSVQLERAYLRLTSAPDPNTVRPPPVLMQSLELVKKKYLERLASGKNPPSDDYFYFNDQMKSIRQDLVVQDVLGQSLRSGGSSSSEGNVSMVRQVYQTHARVAIANGDFGEFNQCLSQLKLIPQVSPDEEFDSYRILYYLYSNQTEHLQELVLDILRRKKTASPLLQQALQAREALSLGDYSSFFRIYKKTASEGKKGGDIFSAACTPHLLSAMVDRERLKALKALCSSYRPTVSGSLLARELAFQSLQELSSWLSCSVQEDVSLVDGRLDARLHYPAIYDKTMQACLRVDIKGQR